MTRKMFEKAGRIPGLQAGPRPVGDSASAVEPTKAKTAPGTMMGFLTAQSGAVQEAEALRARGHHVSAQPLMSGRSQPTRIPSDRPRI